jgi:hypothetical protein
LLDVKSEIKITKDKTLTNKDQPIIKKTNNDEQKTTDVFLTNKLQSTKSKGILAFSDDEIKQIFNSEDV